jgi:hypothetical protein
MLKIQPRYVERTIGFLAALAVFCFSQIAWDYQSSHCHDQRYGSTAPPDSDQKIATPPAPQSRGSDKKVNKHGNGEPSFSCGVLGAPAALVSFIDSHEGFFVGAFTFLLFVSTTLLWRSTADLFQAGERQIAVADKSASAAADAAKATQDSVKLAQKTAAADEARRKVFDRAYVGGGGARRMAVAVNTATGAHFIRATQEFEIHVNNQGRTAAELRHIRYGIFDPEMPLPEQPAYEKTLSFRDLIGPGARSQTTAVIELPDGERAQGIYVRLDYFDLGLQEPHSVGFVMKIEPLNQFPVPIEGLPAYIDPT